MGWAIPAAIGTAFAKNQRIICLTGDGSLQMNIQELALIKKHNLPIKVILFNNDGHSMIRQTQDQWLNSNYIASSNDGGIPLPDYSKIANGYNINSININTKNDINKIENELNTNDPIFMNIKIDPKHRVNPQVKFGRPIEDLEPLLSRQEFSENMIIDTL